MLKIYRKITNIIQLTAILTIGNFGQSLASYAQAENYFPETGTILEIVTGDLMCYITVQDEYGQTDIVGAGFEFCAEPEKYLNQKANFSYSMATVNDCQSIEPCGKTRQVNLITEIEIVD
jgi:hypothetical protein